MKKSIAAGIFISVLMISIALAAGDIARGKNLFNDPKFAGSKNGNSCNTCHPEGKNLENAGTKKEFHIAERTQTSLEEAVNACIVYALGGNPLNPQSADMQDIVAYIKSLGTKS